MPDFVIRNMEGVIIVVFLRRLEKMVVDLGLFHHVDLYCVMKAFGFLNLHKKLQTDGKKERQTTSGCPTLYAKAKKMEAQTLHTMTASRDSIP